MPLKRRDLLLAAGAAVGLSQFQLRRLAANDPPKKRILMFTRSAGYEHSSITREGGNLSHAEKVFTDLGAGHGFEVTASKDGGVFDSDIDGYDAFLFFTTGDLTQPKEGEQPPMSADGKRRLLDAIAGGKGFLGSHCASDTFHSQGAAFERQTDLDPYIAMLGGEFISHGPQQEAYQRVASPRFPGAEGLEASIKINDEWYSLKNFANDIHVILAMETEGMEGSDYKRPPFPSTWARKHHEGRVFYTSMGHREDVWTNATFQQLLLGGLSWAVGNVEVAELPANLLEVTPGAHVMPLPPE